MDTPAANPGASTYDVVIIGAGPAGLTAGMYASRQGLRTGIVAGQVGGQALWADKIENYPGWRLISGKDLVANFRQHVAEFGVDCFEGQLVNAIVPAEDGYEVFTREGTVLSSRSVIIATGKAPNRLAVPGEQEFVGRGVSYCATCDAAFFKDADVAVVGPGESAADAALELASLGARVTLISAQPLKVPAEMLERIEKSPAIRLMIGYKVIEIFGDDFVRGVRVRHAKDKTEQTLPVSGVFIETGAIAVSEFTAGLVDTNEKGEIVIDKRGATTAPWIYAAGDVTDTPAKQIVVAAGEGARAAIAASRDLKKRR